MARLWLTVSPGSHENGVEWDENGLRVRVTGRAVEGKANRELIVVLAEKLGVPKSRIAISKGAGSRYKMIEIAEFDQAEAERVLGKR